MLSQLEAECASTYLPGPATVRLTAGGKAMSATDTDGLGLWQAGVPEKAATWLFNTTAPLTTAPDSVTAVSQVSHAVLERRSISFVTQSKLPTVSEPFPQSPKEIRMRCNDLQPRLSASPGEIETQTMVLGLRPQEFFFFNFIKFIAVTLVNGIIQVSLVQFYNTTSV